MAVEKDIGLESDQVEHIGGDGEIERGGRAKDQEEIFHFGFLSCVFWEGMADAIPSGQEKSKRVRSCRSTRSASSLITSSKAVRRVKSETMVSS